jgi:hypothetical protein
MPSIPSLLVGALIFINCTSNPIASLAKKALHPVAQDNRGAFLATVRLALNLGFRWRKATGEPE